MTIVHWFRRRLNDANDTLLETAMRQLTDPTLFVQSALIDGQWLQADDQATLTVRNPATGATVGTVPNMGAVECRRAVEAAARAFPAWAALSVKRRSDLLRRWYEL